MNIRKTVLVAFALLISITSSTVYSHSGCCGCTSHTITTATTKEKAVVTTTTPTAVVVSQQEQKAKEDKEKEAKKASQHVHGKNCCH